jgi:hypothetical protein
MNKALERRADSQFDYLMSRLGDRIGKDIINPSNKETIFKEGEVLTRQLARALAYIEPNEVVILTIDEYEAQQEKFEREVQEVLDFDAKAKLADQELEDMQRSLND